MPPTRKPVAEVVGPGFVRPRQAAEAIGQHYETVRALVGRGVFTARRTAGVGRAKPIWLYADEVALYAAAAKAGKDPEAAVLRLRLKLGRLTK